MQVTLFLDVEGCLHPNEVWRVPGQGLVLRGGGKLFMHAPRLIEALTPFDVAIVLSSSWVPEVGIAATKREMPKELAARVVGATFDRRRARRWSQLTRYAQIAAYVQQFAIERWLAIDDDVFGWPARERHRLISPQSAVGLTSLDIELLVERLRALTSGGGA